MVLQQHLRKGPQKVLRQLLAEMCSRPMRLRKDLHLQVPTTVRLKSQRDRHSRAQLLQACSYYQRDLQMLVVMLQADSMRQIVLLMMPAALLLNQRGRRCLQAVRCSWRRHCFH